MDFLVRRFIKNYQDTKDANVRTSVGKLSGIVGILNNLFLFVIKFLMLAQILFQSYRSISQINQQIKIILSDMKERKQSHLYL